MKTFFKQLAIKAYALLRLRKPKEGFTLMELLVVVSIIGALSIVAIPAYNTYRKNADDTAARNGAINIYKAYQTCLANGGADTTSVCAKGSVNDTLSPACSTLSAAGTEAAQNGTANSGKCFTRLKAAGTWCVAFNVNGKVHCVDTNGKNESGHFCKDGECSACVITGSSCKP